MRVFVLIGDHVGLASVVLASTMTGMFVAHEMMKPNQVVFCQRVRSHRCPSAVLPPVGA
jgi:hypothetical protein